MTHDFHFHLGGYGNEQNCRILGSDNPRVIVEKYFYPRRVTVWCGFWAGGMIGSDLFKNEAGASKGCFFSRTTEL